MIYKSNLDAKHSGNSIKNEITLKTRETAAKSCQKANKSLDGYFGNSFGIIHAPVGTMGI